MYYKTKYKSKLGNLILVASKDSLIGLWIEGQKYEFQTLEKKDVVVSKIANGIPIGADMEYIDALTLEMALENRKKISE